MIEVTKETIDGLQAEINKKGLQGVSIYADKIDKYMAANPALMKKIDEMAKQIQIVANSDILPDDVQRGLAFASVRNGAWFVIEAILRQEDINKTEEMLG